jgi:MoxR-like ATPase
MNEETDLSSNTYPIGFDSRLPLEELSKAMADIKSELKKIIIGQDEMIDFLLVAMLSKGHVLLEGVPGIAKTLTAKLFSKTIDTDFSRLQFTPDLMPGDVLGTSIFNSKTSSFEFKRGPVFSNLVLIDEINRAPAKTQSALFEVMEERQVTIDGTTYGFDDPFMVLATQNPIESEGTYRLPEAQLDRFIFKINLDYPTLENEFEILKSHYQRKSANPIDEIRPVLTISRLIHFQKITSQVAIDEKILLYITQLVAKTRNHPSLFLGGSPRASLAIMHASQAFAAITGRDFIIPEDVKKSVIPVLRHRIIITPEKEMEGITPEFVIDSIIQSIEIPR